MPPATAVSMGSFAPQLKKGMTRMVATLSFSLARVRVLIIAGTEQPKPIIIGINALPERPNLRKILSSINAKELASILDSGEIGVLEKVPGVGKKTAQKMMLALKGKLTLLDENTGRVKSPKEEGKSPWNDVIMALVDMGYDKKNAEEAIEKIVVKSPNQDGESKSTYEEKLFRLAIVELAK